MANLKFSFSMAHTRMEEGGWTRQVIQRELSVASTLAGVEFGLEPGAYREVHWHVESEWAQVLRGSCRISAVDQEGRNLLDDVREGDLWFLPKGVPHHIQALDEAGSLGPARRRPSEPPPHPTTVQVTERRRAMTGTPQAPPDPLRSRGTVFTLSEWWGCGRWRCR